MAGLWLARRPPLRASPEGRTCRGAVGLRAGADGVPGARAVAAVLGGYFLPITCAIVNRPHPGLQPSVPREALNTGRGLFGEVLQHIINSIIFNNHSLAAADLPQLGRPLALPAGQEPVAAAEANGEGELPHGRVPRQLPLAVGRPLRHGGGGGGPAAAAAPRQPPGARGPRARGSGAAGAGQPPRHIPARPALLAAPRLRRRLRRRRRR